MEENTRFKDDTFMKYSDGEFEYSLEPGHSEVRVKLPFDIDVKRLSDMVSKRGYYIDSDPDDTDSQNWGSDYDLEGYYPYSIYKDNGKWYFAFPPEDYSVKGPGKETELDPFIGKRAIKEFQHWLPILKKSKKTTAELSPKH